MYFPRSLETHARCDESDRVINLNKTNMTTEQENQETISRRSLIDQSARIPVLFFITSASAWLLVAVTLGFIQQMKMHAPGFLDESWLYFLN